MLDTRHWRCETRDGGSPQEAQKTGKTTSNAERNSRLYEKKAKIV